jgi:tRNA (adenine37-N6)-methyltransferase
MRRWIMSYPGSFSMVAIGVVESPHRRKEDCPTQAAVASDAAGTVRVFDDYAAGLADIELFSHIILLYVFDRAGPTQLSVLPFLDDAVHGVFATRHPRRPNGIGMSIVRLKRRDGACLEVEGLDVLDGTPVLDIKPYVPQFDIVPGASSGWLAGKPWRPKPPGRE